MDRNVVIKGLSRQAQFMGLPLPYALVVGAFWFLPFICVDFHLEVSRFSE